MVLGLLAGYLFMVTAALPLHRNQANHARSTGAEPAPVCGLCGAPACQDRELPGNDGIASTAEMVAGSTATHRAADCFICQTLAQKHVLADGPAEIFWVEAGQQAAVSQPRAAPCTVPLPWQIRAPPCAA